MSQPVEVDLPHQLGREEAKRRIAGNTHTLKDHIPGGMAEVHEAWDGDHLTMTVNAMGQQVVALIDITDTNVHCRIDLPGMLGMFSGAITSAFRKHGKKILLEDHSGD